MWGGQGGGWDGENGDMGWDGVLFWLTMLCVLGHPLTCCPAMTDGPDTRSYVSWMSGYLHTRATRMLSEAPSSYEVCNSPPHCPAPRKCSQTSSMSS